MPKEFWDATKAVAPPAQQPEGPDGVAFALSVRLTHANDARREAEAERDALREKLAAMPTLWTCPRCAFSFDAIHADGSCPCCDEAAREKENAALREKLSRAREALEAARLSIRVSIEGYGDCDHDVNYCICEEHDALALVEAALSETPSAPNQGGGT